MGDKNINICCECGGELEEYTNFYTMRIGKYCPNCKLNWEGVDERLHDKVVPQPKEQGENRKEKERG